MKKSSMMHIKQIIALSTLFLSYLPSTLSSGGGIQKLATLTKENTLIKNMNFPSGVRTKNVELAGEMQEREILYNALMAWSQQEEPIACLIFHERSFYQRKGLMNFRKNFQAKLSLGTIDVGLISFISPEVLASLDLHQTMFKKGNLTFQFMKREPRTKDYDVLACCVTSYVDLMNMLRKTGIMVSSGGIKKVLKKELQEDFELYLINDCTLNEFIDLVDTHIREIEATLSEKTLPNELLVIASELLQEYSAYKKHAHTYLCSFSSKKTTRLSDIFMAIVESKQFSPSACHEFSHNLLVRYPKLHIFYAVLHVLEAVKTYRNIYYQTLLEEGDHMSTMLMRLGYQCNSIGRNFLLFENIGFNSTLIEKEQIELFYKGFSRENSLSPITAPQPTVLFFHSDDTLKEYPELNHELSSCAHCASKITEQSLFGLSLERKPFCSASCFFQQYLRALPKELSALLEKRTLSNEEKHLLEQLATLVYYRFVTLAPSTQSTHSDFYAFPLAKLSSLLDNVQKFSSFPENKTIFEYAQLLGISLNDLTLFTKVYTKIKSDYLEKLLTLAKKRTYESLEDADPIIFDEQSRIKKLQSVHAERLKKHIGLLPATADAATGRFYHALLQHILEQLKVSTIDFELILKEGFTPTHTPLEIPSAERIVSLSSAPSLTALPVHPTNTTAEESFFEEEEPSESFAAPEVTIAESELSSFKEHPSRRPRAPIREIHDSFFGLEPYTIRLFNARSFIPREEELTNAHSLFSTCEKIDHATRISILFGLAEHFQEKSLLSIARNTYGMPTLIAHGANQEYDASLVERLTLDHLFSPLVERFLKSFGIVEKKNDLIQVSIPGEIKESTGRRSLGYFQFTFIPESWKCIHRAFANYTVNNDTYVSKVLKKALLDFLLANEHDDPFYAPIIDALEK